MAKSFNHHRDPRTLLYQRNSGLGILVALAVPLELGKRNVFLSYAFQAYYGFPRQTTDYFPGLRLDLVEERSSSCETNFNSTCDEGPKKKDHKKNKRPKRQPLISRTTFYKALEDKFKHAGYNGKDCLLRLICETSAFSLGEHSGVWGSIFHIMFTPTSSMDEGLTEEYYEAEGNGVQGNCEGYENRCQESLLDLISDEFNY